MVSLLSLGAMCADGWKRKKYNPAGIRVVTHEVTVFDFLGLVHVLKFDPCLVV